MIIKKCVGCNKDFYLETKSGSGGTASLRRKYCSDSCKRTYKIKNGKNNYIVVSCLICFKDIKKFPSLIKNNNFCSKNCQNIWLNGIKKILVKQCLICNKNYDCISSSIAGRNRKFCSTKCAYKQKKKKIGKNILCLNCNKEFYCNRYSLNTRKYCSNPCQFESQSKGIKKIPTNGRSGFRKDLPNNEYFKSSLEADYARYLIKNSIKYEYEKQTFTVVVKGKNKFYTPDFFLVEQNKYIELKGSMTRTKYNKNLDSVDYLISNGIKIEVLYMKDFYDFLKKTGEYKHMFLEAKNYKKSKDILLEK